MVREERNGKLRDVPLWLGIGLPVVSVGILWVTPLLGRRRWDLLIPDEIGFLEIGTIALLLPAIVIGVLIFLHRRRLPRGVGWLMLLAALAALYFAGEEASWGQTYIGWETPETFVELNRQQETNLHNLELLKYGPWVDLLDDVVSNIPRQMMLMFTIVGGIILPVVLRRRLSRPGAREGFWYWMVPTTHLVLPSLVAAFSTVPEKLYKATLRGTPHAWARDGYAYLAFIAPAGEFKEYCFAMVMLLYLLSVYLRLRSLPAAPGIAAAGE